MALLEKEATRFAEALDDCEHVSVTNIGGTEDTGYRLVIQDHRFNMDYEIGYHCDYWDFVSYYWSHRMWPVKPFPKPDVA